MEERKKGLRDFTLEMEESSEKKIRLLYLYLLREEGNERFFSLSLSNFFNFFSFLLPKMRKKNAKCL